MAGDNEKEREKRKMTLISTAVLVQKDCAGDLPRQEKLKGARGDPSHSTTKKGKKTS